MAILQDIDDVTLGEETPLLSDNVIEEYKVDLSSPLSHNSNTNLRIDRWRLFFFAIGVLLLFYIGLWENDQRKDEIGSLQNNIGDLNSNISTLTTQLKQLLEESVAENEQMNSEIGSLRSDLENEKHKRNNSIQDRKRLHDNITVLTTQLRESRNELAETIKQNIQDKKEIAEMGNNIGNIIQIMPSNIKSITNGLCLDIPNSNMRNGNALQLSSCDYGKKSNQLWTTDGLGQIHSFLDSTKCVGIQYPGTPQILLWDCHSGWISQKWKWESNGQIRSMWKTNLCFKECGNSGCLGLQECVGSSQESFNKTI